MFHCCDWPVHSRRGKKQKRRDGGTFTVVHSCDLTNNRIRAARAGMFGGAAVIGALFFTSGIPRIQNDVLAVRFVVSSWKKLY